MKPKISVILPYYNDQETLSESIDSILAQDFTDYELLLIDNNSSDRSYEIATSFAAEDGRVQLISVMEQGIVPALNAGIAVAKGKYIARMDADDISHPQRLQLQYEFLEKNPDYGLVACCVNYAYQEEPQEGLAEYVRWNNQLLTYEEICLNRFIESPLVHPTVMFRSELPGRYGSYEQGAFPEDYELWLRWIDKGVKIHKLNEVLLDWRDSDSRLTRTDERYSTQAFYETKTTYLYNWLKENNPFYPKVVIWGAGRVSRQRFSLLHDLGIIPKFFIDLRANPARKVIEHTHTPPAGRHFIISYVANRSARENIREFLFELGYIEGKDFICVA